MATKRVSKDEPGKLLKGKLEPGELVFSDQYVSKVPGRAFTTWGTASSMQFGGGTIFYDAASGYIYVSHQVGLAAAETIQSKMKYEHAAMGDGVRVSAYHTDNGIYKSSEFMKELAQKGQGIKMSGISVQFQNGPAENAIKIVVQKA